jgi:DNA-binding CsgD family transcriptional regulator
MTMANGLTIPSPPGGPGGYGRVTAWTPAAPAARKVDRSPRDLDGTQRDGAGFLRATAEARTALREAAAAAAEAASQAHSLAELLNEALAVLREMETAPTPASMPANGSPPEADALSPREREVLALVAEGRTNKAIAAELFVSPNTVKTHVASLLTKLNADTRVQLAAIATRQGLHHRAAIGITI